MPTIPSDPLFSQQWHLRNTNAGEFDLNVTGVWDDYTGAGIQVAVWDDGFDYTNSDLSPNYRTDLDYDYGSGDFDAAATGGNNHGTAVMGIVGAAANGSGAVGVAYGADLIGYTFGGFGATVLRDAAGIGSGVGNTLGDEGGADVINMSFGQGSSVFLNASALRARITAMSDASAEGRDGLGMIMVKSSGNSRAAPGSTAREEGTAEMMDSTPFSINVAALRADGWVTSYSTPGANVLVSALANGVASGGGITTTDRVGASGYSSGDHTSTFAGTSAAAPQVSGIAALMLEANPDLGWRDVQMILAASARHVGSDVGAAANTGAPRSGDDEQATQANGATWFWNGATHWNGGAMHFSNDYGYGLVDALAAVRLAETWHLQSISANRESVTYNNLLNSTVVLDGSADSVSVTVTETIVVEHVEVTFDFSSTNLADLEIFLIGPDQTRVQLIADTGDSGDYSGSWTFGTTAFMGVLSAGEWVVQFGDDAAGAATSFDDIDIVFHGRDASDEDFFILTNEFADLVSDGTHAATFAGGAGNDVLNAAAVTAASVLDLEAGSGTIDGTAVSLDSIETIFTGDGNDIITGVTAGGLLSTGRGDDRVEADTGTQTADGGAGEDTIDLGRGDDTMTGGSGADRFVYRIGYDQDLITDYEAGSDVIVLRMPGVASQADALSFASVDAGDVIFDFGSGDVLRVSGAGPLQLSNITVEVEPPESLAASDLNGDGTSDILWHNPTTGGVGQFRMDNGAPSWSGLGTGAVGWEIVGIADVTGDTIDDILWYNPATGQLGQYDMSGGTPSWAGIGAGAAGWSVAGAGDFDGDGTDDILWFNEATGGLGQYRMSGGSPAWGGLGTGAAGWDVAGVGDFDGDGTDDILWFNASTGQLGQFDMGGGAPIWRGIATAASGWDVAAIGDYNGDGTDDILVANAASGQVGQFQMLGGSAAWRGVGTGAPGWSIVDPDDGGLLV